jgi:hypothetical protein
MDHLIAHELLAGELAAYRNLDFYHVRARLGECISYRNRDGIEYEITVIVRWCDLKDSDIRVIGVVAETTWGGPHDSLEDSFVVSWPGVSRNAIWSLRFAIGATVVFVSAILLLPRTDIVEAAGRHRLSLFDGLIVACICGCVIMSVAAILDGARAERETAGTGCVRSAIGMMTGFALLITVPFWTLAVLFAPYH